MGPAEASQAPGVVNLESITDPDDRLNPCNPANNVNYTVDGWPTLTKVIEQESSLEAFATFTDLNIKSLLYYQAELIYLRKELHRVEWKDFRASEDDCRSRYANNLEFLIAEREGSIASAGSENPLPLPEQWILIERIRTTLDKYNSALLQFSAMAKLREADVANVETLTTGVVKKVGKHQTALTGAGAFTWGNYNEASIMREKSLAELFWGLFTGIFISPASEIPVKDSEVKEHLVTIRSPKTPDGLAKWVTQSYLPFYWQLQMMYPCRPRTKYLLPLWPIWATLIVILLSLNTLWRALLLLWRRVAPLKLPDINNAGELGKWNLV